MVGENDSHASSSEIRREPSSNDNCAHADAVRREHGAPRCCAAALCRSAVLCRGDVVLRCGAIKPVEAKAQPRQNNCADQGFVLSSGLGMRGIKSTRSRATDPHHHPQGSRDDATTANYSVPILKCTRNKLAHLFPGAGFPTMCISV